MSQFGMCWSITRLEPCPRHLWALRPCKIYKKLTYQGSGAARRVSSESRSRLTRGEKPSVKVRYYSPLVAKIWTHNLSRPMRDRDRKGATPTVPSGQWEAKTQIWRRRRNRYKQKPGQARAGQSLLVRRPCVTDLSYHYVSIVYQIVFQIVVNYIILDGSLTSGSYFPPFWTSKFRRGPVYGDCETFKLIIWAQLWGRLDYSHPFYNFSVLSTGHSLCHQGETLVFQWQRAGLLGVSNRRYIDNTS